MVPVPAWQSWFAALGFGAVLLKPSPLRARTAADAASRLAMVATASALVVSAVPLNGLWDGQRVRNEP